jgi:serine/threonine protein kinase
MQRALRNRSAAMDRLDSNTGAGDEFDQLDLGPPADDDPLPTVRPRPHEHTVRFIPQINTLRTSGAALCEIDAFASPEQKSGRPTDARSDLYAFGMIVFSILTGELHGELFPSARRIVPELSPAWDELIGRCLRPDPAERIQTAAEARRMIESIPTSPGHPSPNPPPGRTR